MKVPMNIVGSNFHQGANLTISKMSAGDGVQFERQPNNIHDKNAIAVRTNEGKMLGFIPREFAEVLAPQFDEGEVSAKGEYHKNKMVLLFLAAPWEEDATGNEEPSGSRRAGVSDLDDEIPF